MRLYQAKRGLDVVKVLAQLFKDRTWYLPDLICDEVYDVLAARKIVTYHIDTSLKPEAGIKIEKGETPIVYFISYFGCEVAQYVNIPGIVIKDSVSLPFPFEPVRPNEIWFNSFRKIVPGSLSSHVYTPFDLGKDAWVHPTAKFNIGHDSPEITWTEVLTRGENYNVLYNELVGTGYLIQTRHADYTSIWKPHFPSVFPIRIANREEILSRVLLPVTWKSKHGHDIPLPGMWENEMKLDNRLYNEILLIPLDSRFTKEQLLDVAKLIRKEGKPCTH